MRLIRSWLIVGLAVLASANVSSAQGVQTGTITGTVQSADGLSLPGVTVTATSPALQGQRTAVTDLNGVYFIKGLPAGAYAVVFEISSFKPATKNVEVGVGGTSEASQSLALAGVAETVTVTGTTTPQPLVVPTLNQVYTKRDVDLLPVGRTPSQIADLAPALTSNSPNSGQVNIAGATAFDNVFMINGVDINDNLFGTTTNLFIEDAIQETNVLTGGISAEYGRFTGGVINMVTKSGGNSFSGSFRENVFNPKKWLKETPRQVTNGISNPDIWSKSSEGTFGGPIVKNALWFFSSGRYETMDSTNTFFFSSQSSLRHDLNKRGEIKLTGTPAPGQTISGDYTNNSTAQNNRFSLNSNSLDPSVLVSETQPNDLFVTNYNGVLGSKFFASLQFSQKRFKFQNAGGTDPSVTASPIRTRGLVSGIPSGLLYGAPFFSALDPEQRNNRQFTGSLAYTLSTKSAGTHDIKGGGEYFRSQRTGGNSQSATGYVFQTDYLQAGGQPVRDASGVPIPVWTPGVTRVQNWLSTVGSVININTSSLYLQDHWVVSPRLTADLGTRFEVVRSNATGGIVTVDTTAIVPRLGVTYDLQGGGKTVLQATYGHYAGKYSEAQFAANTDVGNPSRVTYAYTGPAGQGRDFAPAYDVANNFKTIVSASFPTANIFTAPSLSSPLVKEFTTAIGRELGQRGFAKVTYQHRTWSNFVEDYIQLSNGIVNVNRNGANIGNLTKVVYGNTNDVVRRYDAIVLQNSYRFRDTISYGAHYTVQLRNKGTNAGEAANQPGLSSAFGDYPEILGPAIDRYQPYGNLADFERHKLRVYGTYTQRLGRFGAVDMSPIWRVDSGRTFSYTAASVPLSSVELARNPGYPANDINANTAYNLFFGDRGTGQFPGYGVLDFAATYSVPVWRTGRPWVKLEIYNVLNNQKLIAWDTTVTADPNSPKDANGLPTGYLRGPNFGTATADVISSVPAYPLPIPGGTFNGGRLIRVAFGFRF
jgi:hypothetical protein